MRSFAAALFCAFVFAWPAFADDEHDTCLKSAKADETRCGDEWIAREQKRLDEVWQQLAGMVEGDMAKALRDEQDAWNGFSRLACLFKKDPGFGGAAGPTGYHACRAELIAGRAEALRGYISYIDN